MAQENNTHELRHVSGHYQSCRWARIDPVHSPHRLFPQSPPEMATRTFLAESDKDLPNQVSPEPILPGSCRVQSHPGHQNILLCCCRVGQLAPDTLEHKQEAQTWTGNGGQTRSGTITWLLAGWLEDHLLTTPARFCPADTEPAKEGRPGSCILYPNTHHVTPPQRISRTEHNLAQHSSAHKRFLFCSL